MQKFENQNHPGKIRTDNFVLALTGIILITAVPVDFRAPLPWSLAFDLMDFLLNVILYAPLGLFWRRPIARVIVLGAVLSAGIEFLQMWYVGRDGSLFDVLANTLGVAFGVVAGHFLAPLNSISSTTFSLDRQLAAVAAIAAMLLIAAWASPYSPSTISNWDSGYDILLGNERTADRGWHGTITSLAILPEPLTRDEVQILSNLADPVVRATLIRKGAYLLPAPIELNGAAAMPLPPDVTREFYVAALKRNAFTMIAVIATADIRQRGPARVISYSTDTFHRNFDFGQEGERLSFRVRTAITGTNGMDPHTVTTPVLEAGRPYSVVATFDGAVARVFVNGHLRGRQNLAAAGCVVTAACDTELPFAAALFGAFLAIIAIVFCENLRSRLFAHLLIVFAATAGAMLLAILAVDRGTLFSGWGAPVMVLLGATCAYFILTPDTTVI